jgi:dipeptidyl aminopeptidase/acylaminoacyl peptidase
MSQRHVARFFAALVCALVVAQWVVTAQSPAPAKRPITYDVIDSWRSIGGTRLSPDGQWVAYALTSQAEDGELVVRNLKTGQEFRHPRGTGPQFTTDNAFVIFTIAQSKADEEKERQSEPAGASGSQAAGATQGARGEGGAAPAAREPKTGLGIMALPTGKVTEVEKVGSFRLAQDSGTWLAYYKGVGGAGGGARGAGARGAGGGARGAGGGAPAAGARGAVPASGAGGRGARGGTREKRKDPGSDLVLRRLASGEETTIPEVTEYDVDDKGVTLAYATSSADAAKDGVFLRKLADGSVRTLMTGRGHYKSLTFDEPAQQLAFFSDQADYEKPVSPYRLYVWKGGDGQAAELVSGATAGVPAGLVVADSAAPRFSRKGDMIFISVGPPPAPAAPAGDAAEKTPAAPAPVNVDLWSYKDAIIQPMQKVRAEQDRTRSYRGVVHLGDGRYVQLATKDLPNVTPGDDPRAAVGTSDLPYRMESSWDQTYSDVYLVDLQTGKPTKVLEHWGSTVTSLSPGGKYLLYFDENAGHWWTCRVADGARTNLTEKLKVRFQQDFTTPDLPGPYGNRAAGWTADDQSVLLYDEFDVWEVKPDGSSARMITNGEGRKQALAFRYTTLDPEERIIPTGKPLLLSTTNDRTKATGFYRTAFTGTGAPEKLIMVDKRLGALTKAAKADTLVFTQSRFDEFPDLWVSSDTTFKDAKRVSSANPQQAQFAWGKSEIVEYINGDGKRLHAILIKPENFDPTRKYPLMVYIYEELSNNLHSYVAPNVGTSINVARYVSNGYVVLEPDIVYTTGFPGQSAEKCVIPAVNTVVAQGYIDQKRIGIQGHSWGAYQITHLITRTDMFAAVEAGAAVSNMISAYGGIRWGTGMVREFQYEKTQSRIGAPPWDAPLLYIENSPIFWIKNIHTPYLTIHNDADDAVPWYQGIEFNTAMRRLGKEAYMFTYNGELHGLRNRDNMKHWTVHLDEFFDHYLLGRSRPAWMDSGVSFLDRGKRDVSPLFKKKTEAVVAPVAVPGATKTPAPAAAAAPQKK